MQIAEELKKTNLPQILWIYISTPKSEKHYAMHIWKL